MQLYVFARFYFLQVQIQLHMMQANCAPGEPRHQNCIWHGIQKTDKSYGRCHLIVLLWRLENFLFHSWYLRSHTGSCCHCHVIASCLHIKSYKLTCTIMMVMLLTGRSDACSCRKAIANCFQYLSKKKIFWKIQVASSHKMHRHKLTKKEILYTRKHGMLLWNQIVLTRFLYQLHAWAKYDTSE